MIKKYLWLFCLIFFSCENNKKIKQNNKDKDKLLGKEIIFPNEFQIERTSKYLIFVYFNGNCSKCIGETIEFIDKINKLNNDKIDYLFLSRSNDVELIKFYLDEKKIEPQYFQYIKADSKDIMIKENIFLDSYMNILLLNKKNKILSSKDPFKSTGTMEVYSNILN